MYKSLLDSFEMNLMNQQEWPISTIYLLVFTVFRTFCAA